MSFIKGIMGNASQISISEIEKNYSKLFFDGEIIESGYSLIRDKFIFTNKRLILIDHQGVTGKKIEYHSLPYNKITHFSIETAGHLDLDAELKIWISGNREPIEKQFSKSVDIYEVQSILAKYILD